MRYFKMRVKSREKLEKLFRQSHYVRELSGYRDTNSNAYINGDMLHMAGDIISVIECTTTRGYSYDSPQFMWHKDWLEEVNPIWLNQKGK